MQVCCGNKEPSPFLSTAQAAHTSQRSALSAFTLPFSSGSRRRRTAFAFLLPALRTSLSPHCRWANTQLSGEKWDQSLKDQASSKWKQAAEHGGEDMPLRYRTHMKQSSSSSWSACTDAPEPPPSCAMTLGSGAGAPRDKRYHSTLAVSDSGSISSLCVM